MAKKLGKRIWREATAAERRRHRKIREQLEQELPALKKRGRQALDRARQRGIAIRHVIALLKSERIKQGLSLSEINQRTGIQRSTLSRLESNREANPTIGTLARFADAVGKKVLVVLDDADGSDE